MNFGLLSSLLPTFSVKADSQKCEQLSQVADTLELSLPAYLTELEDGESGMFNLEKLFEEVIRILESELNLILRSQTSITTSEKVFIGLLLQHVQLTATLINLYTQSKFKRWAIEEKLLRKIFTLGKSIKLLS